MFRVGRKVWNLVPNFMNPVEESGTMTMNVQRSSDDREYLSMRRRSVRKPD